VSAYEAALAELAAAGVLVFAAAGNEQVDNDALAATGYANVPCNVPADNIVAVGATDKGLARWAQGEASTLARVKGSNWGAAQVDVGAPGAYIVGAKAGSSGGVETR
jgi:Subtilase family